MPLDGIDIGVLLACLLDVTAAKGNGLSDPIECPMDICPFSRMENLIGISKNSKAGRVSLSMGIRGFEYPFTPLTNKKEH